jgi:hypothetical protein
MNLSVVGKYSWYSFKEKKEWASKKSQEAYSSGDKSKGDMFANISEAYSCAELRNRETR